MMVDYSFLLYALAAAGFCWSALTLFRVLFVVVLLKRLGEKPEEAKKYNDLFFASVGVTILSLLLLVILAYF